VIDIIDSPSKGEKSCQTWELTNPELFSQAKPQTATIQTHRRTIARKVKIRQRHPSLGGYRHARPEAKGEMGSSTPSAATFAAWITPDGLEFQFRRKLNSIS
jgi:hypothetical protein